MLNPPGLSGEPNIPTKQGKILLSTEDGKYGMADVTASVVTITLTDLS